MKKEDGLKIVKAEVSNFKNISHATVDAEGRSFLVVGANGAGKSSLIQAIMAAFDQRGVGEYNVKEGTEYARVSLDLKGYFNGAATGYTVEVTFDQKNKRGRIKVYNKDGEVVKSGIDSILKYISFDVFDFIRKGRTATGKPSEPGMREQVDIIKSLLPDTEKVQLMAVESVYKETYEERTLDNRRIDQLKALIANSKFSQEEIEKYSVKVDEAPILADYGKVEKAIANFEKVERGVKEREDIINNNLAKIQNIQSENTQIEERINQLMQQIENNKEKIKTIESDNVLIAELTEKGKQWLNANVKPDSNEVSQRLALAREHNANHAKVADFSRAYEELNSLQQESEKKTLKLQQLKDEKVTLFQKSSIGKIVNGLTFDDDRLYYNGKPFDEQTQPKSVIIGVGMRIAMAMNPELKVIVINDGSLLDNESLSTAIKVANKYGYQLIVEVVGNKDESLHVEYTEENN
jgi:DNA repair exonuclease SbcCD ATPase subunit